MCLVISILGLSVCSALLWTLLVVAAGAIPNADINSMQTCVCSQEKLLGLQQLFQAMWRAGVAACIALAALLAVGELGQLACSQ